VSGRRIIEAMIAGEDCGIGSGHAGVPGSALFRLW